MMELMITYQWEIFISLEVLSLVFLVAFLFIRYAFTKQGLSRLFLLLFILCIAFEAVIALLIYQRTGEISTFQIVIGIFIIYACTFGISDFKKLDRYIKSKVGKWRGINLLTEADLRKMEQAKDPIVVARKNRRWWYAHAFVFVIAHYVFWVYYGSNSHDFSYYLSDFSWWEDKGSANGPFQHEVVGGISKIWTIVFAVDTIICWSYTLFPNKR